MSYGPDARRIAAEVAEHVACLSRTAEELEVADPVGTRFADVVGSGNQLHEAAELWRRVAERVEDATGAVKVRLGGIDEAWQGADADAFIEHVRSSGLTGNDVVDSMRGLAAALDQTAETILVLVRDMGEVITEGSESVSEVLRDPVDGAKRARDQLVEMERPTREIFESVEDVLRAFVRFCEEFGSMREFAEFRPETDSVAKNSEFPPRGATAAPAEAAADPASASGGDATGGGASGEVGAGGAATSGAGALAEGDTTKAVEPSETPPSSSAASAAAMGAGAVVGGGVAAGMMPMGVMGAVGPGGGRAQERQNSSRMRAEPEELFGVREEAAPAVFGGDRDSDEERESEAEKADSQPEQRSPLVDGTGLIDR